MPIGPEFNPATVVGALNRPEVRAVIIPFWISIILVSILLFARLASNMDYKNSGDEETGSNYKTNRV